MPSDHYTQPTSKLLENTDFPLASNQNREAKKTSRTVSAFLLSGYGTPGSLFSADVGP